METNTGKIILDETTADYKFFAVQPYERKEIWTEGKRKTAGGLKHFYGWYPQMTRAEVLTLVHQAPLFTPRPYRLGQCCDGTVANCVTALFIAFCKRFGYSAAELYESAYKNENEPFTKDDQADLVEDAEWEGVEYPSLWDEPARAGLIASLTAINNHSLVGVMVELPEYLGFDIQVGKFQGAQ